MRRRPMPSPRRKYPQRGLATLELALLLPTLILLVFGTIELGRLLWIQTVLQHATQTAARFAMVRGLESDIPATDQEVLDELRRLGLGMNPEQLSAEILTPWPQGSAPGAALSLRARYTFEWQWPLRMAGSSVILQATVTSTMSQ